MVLVLAQAKKRLTKKTKTSSRSTVRKKLLDSFEVLGLTKFVIPVKPPTALEEVVKGTPKVEEEARAVSVEGLKDLMLGKRFEPAEIPQEFFAIGGRVGFADGSDPKDPKMNRRTFMKVMGGLASIPLLGKFIKSFFKTIFYTSTL